MCAAIFLIIIFVDFLLQIAQRLTSRVFDQFVLPNMTYEVENWATTENNIETTRMAPRNTERTMLHLTREDKIRNEKKKIQRKATRHWHQNSTIKGELRGTHSRRRHTSVELKSL